MEENNKPDEVFKLEKFYGISLEEVNENIFEKGNSYLLDEDKNIIGLSLVNNLIADLSPLSKLSNLIDLDLSNNQISNLSPISNLTNLEIVVLKENQISDLNPLSNVINLKTLSLSKNQISNLNPLSNLINLKTLFLSSNQISTIEDLDKLINLTLINLTNNQISDLNPLLNLINLKKLSLSMNKISNLNPLSNLIKLNSLNLWSNRISNLNPLSNLTKLNHLDLWNNKISNKDIIYNLLEKLKELKFLQISDNPFLEGLNLNIKNGIEDNNLQDMKNYFKEMEEARPIKLNKKIMLLGNHSSGKSTFLNTFLGKNEKIESTHILNIQEYKDSDDENTEAIFYDFGGQDYYHGLYKAFLSNDSINLIFWKKDLDNNSLVNDKSKRKENTQNFTKEYWIKQLSYFNTSTKEKTKKHWLVQTHIDKDNISYLNNQDLSKNIHRKFHINAKDKSCIDFNYLKTHLLYEIKDKEEIKKSPTYLELYEYIQESVSKDSINIKALQKEFSLDEEMSKYHLRQFSRQGLILYYPNVEKIKNLVWLNPSLTIKHIHDNIFDEESISTYKGIVPKKEFENICDENLRLMLKENKVIYFDEKEQNYIIPSYLPSLKEDSSEFFYIFDIQTPYITLKFEYFIPFGFINRLITIYGEKPNIKKYWKDMLLFTINDENNENKKIKILIRLNFEELKIKLFLVAGKECSKKEIKKIKSNLFEDILVFYHDLEAYKSKLYKYEENEEVNYKELYLQKNKDIPDDLYISLDDTYFVHYKTLEDEKKTKNTIVSYKIENNKINKEKSRTLSTRAFKNYSTNKEINNMKKIFISYSRKDVEYRDELRKHLNMLKTFDIADNWACEDIQIGKWHDQIQKELEDSDLIIYMLSANFFSSAYILEQEVIKGMKLISENPDKKILPIIVSEFVGLDKLKKAIDEPTEEQKAILTLGDFQFLAYSKSVNSLTKQKEEKVISLKEFSNKNELEKGLTQIVERIVEEL